MDRGAWWATVHRLAKIWTRLSAHTQNLRFSTLLVMMRETDMIQSQFCLFLRTYTVRAADILQRKY